MNENSEFVIVELGEASEVTKTQQPTGIVDGGTEYPFLADPA